MTTSTQVNTVTTSTPSASLSVPPSVPPSGAPSANTININFDSLNAYTVSVRFNAATVAQEDQHPNHSHDWILDSGTVETMTYSKYYFTSFTPCVHTAKTATDKAFQTVGYGTVLIELADEQNRPCGLLEIDRAWYMPALSHNLILCKQLARQGVYIHIKTKETTVLIQHGKQIGFTTAKDA
ncbi:uncharacterized protein BO87DRAFT_392110 [Aspergillus neoniger CBS 115656]|uniref:Retrovirus-related Pol polyprotein from transposon TNT 1-94-like beta-barrel domain-containing protein n=1 Tax=Aspergillus neoniger (strain CBS 115656) TaxID=1448310 RepID=A0A318Y1G1_ASPNB|nr:hypothetical protein BO87DRAFT_392110 [Aspergillus neoniger CBS 115656]PYH28195.1 hypothetical protein BO87DRAFT_392110 [Aspergillus neoniger CBS 115656]